MTKLVLLKTETPPTEDISEQICERLKGQNFFSVTISKDGKEFEFNSNNVSPHEIVYMANLLINKLMNDAI